MTLPRHAMEIWESKNVATNIISIPQNFRSFTIFSRKFFKKLAATAKYETDCE